jgi:hypothetical protein
MQVSSMHKVCLYKDYYYHNYYYNVLMFNQNSGWTAIPYQHLFYIIDKIHEATKKFYKFQLVGIEMMKKEILE